jgi:hypothetical protein
MCRQKSVELRSFLVELFCFFSSHGQGGQAGDLTSLYLLGNRYSKNGEIKTKFRCEVHVQNFMADRTVHPARLWLDIEGGDLLFQHGNSIFAKMLTFDSKWSNCFSPLVAANFFVCGLCLFLLNFRKHFPVQMLCVLHA